MPAKSTETPSPRSACSSTASTRPRTQFAQSGDCSGRTARRWRISPQRAAGIHPFLVTPQYSVTTRARIGDDPLIAPHQAVVFEADAARARAIARDGIGMFVGLPAYQRNLCRIGFTDADLVPGGSDRLIDAVVAWGTPEDIRSRIQAHLDAGADHVAVHVLGAQDSEPRPQWRELAALVRALA